MIRSGKRGHLPIFTLIYIIIPRGGGFNGGVQKSERAKNITKMFAGKNYSHRPIFMHVARKILELAFVLIFNWIKLHFLGVRIGLTPKNV